jgi:hypothetical protein
MQSIKKRKTVTIYTCSYCFKQSYSELSIKHCEDECIRDLLETLEKIRSTGYSSDKFPPIAKELQAIYHHFYPCRIKRNKEKQI